MGVDDILLRKEELPILYDSCFQIPLHPRLLDKAITLDPTLAKKVFPTVAQEWFDDLTKYVDDPKDKDAKQWIREAFLRERPVIIDDCGTPKMESTGWSVRVGHEKNGFARCLSMSATTNIAYFTADDMSCRTAIIPIRERDPHEEHSRQYIRFTEKKAEEFRHGKPVPGEEKFFELAVYGLHNVDAYPGALFLRNWALAYVNEAMKKVL